MKYLYNRSQVFKTRFIYQEISGRNEAYAETIDNLTTPDVTFTDEVIEEALGRLAPFLENITPADLALACDGVDFTNVQGVDGLTSTIETCLEDFDPAAARAAERATAAPNDETEPSGVAIPLTSEEFDEIYDNLESGVHIPDSMRADIQAYVLSNLETSANPDDEANTEQLDQTEIDRLAETMITNHAIFLRTVEFGETQLDGTSITDAREDDPDAESVSDVAHRISGEFDHVSPAMLMRAMAGNHEGFGVDENGESTPITEDAIRELAESLNETGAEIDEELQEQGYTPGTPEYRQAYNQRMNQAVERMRLQDVETLGDLIRLFLQYAFPEQFEEEGGPFDANGRPLGTATPRGSTRSRGSVESLAGHPGTINLNPEFYGPDMIAQYEALPENYRQAVEQITEGWDEGWQLPVIRHAINAHRYGQPFSANRPFFANDLGTQRAVIYIPGEAPIEVPCHGGSGGISNVSESHGSPLGSFNFTPGDVAFLPNHRYRARATVHGFEPMRENFRTSYEQGGNIDPSAGNDNSAGRAILMHGSNGTTWGCWGIPQETAVAFARAIEQYGGASGEAFVSTAA